MVQNSCHVISDQIVTGGPLSLATVRLDEKEKDPASIGLIDGDLIQPFRFDSLDFSYTIAL